MFTHVVVFWLNDEVDKSAAVKKLADDCDTLLRKIPGVRFLSTGVTANTPRPIVDNSYDFALCVVYDDKAGHDLYQDHPNHQQFLANNKAGFKKTLVYDFI